MTSLIEAARNGARRLLPWAVPVAVLVICELSALFGWLSTRILPKLLAVLKAGWTQALSGELWTHIRVSSGRALAGFAIGGGLGLVLGLLTGFRKIKIALDTTLQMIRNIPPLALIPLVILIVAETISAQAGIGYMTMNAREFLQTDVVLLGILLYALLGKLADVAARLPEHRWLRWNGAYSAA